jgi:hypothetical protein
MRSRKGISLDGKLKRYGQLLTELQTLTEAISGLERKKQYYDSLLSLVQETLGEDPTTHVQPNLVTRQGPVADELKTMRLLLARVTDHLNSANLELKPHDTATTEPEEMDMDKENWNAISRVLDKVNDEPSHP